MLETSRSSSNNPNHKILAIEDDPEVLALYKTYLQKRGYEVLSATGAVEGMNLLSANPDTRLILLDLNLPGTDGREVLASIKADDDLRQIPVIVFSTSRDHRDVEACYRAGANSYVQKPVDLPEFRRALDSVKSYWFETVLLPAE